VRQPQELHGIWVGGAAIALFAQPVWAAATPVTSVRLNPTQSSLEVILETQAGEAKGSDSAVRPEAFTVSRGNELIADLSDTQLRLNKGNSFRQENPMPGIAAVAVTQLDDNKIRVSVSGANSPPTGQVLRTEGKAIAFSFSPGAADQPALGDKASPTSAIAPALAPIRTAQLPQVPPQNSPIPPPQTTPASPGVLVPNPDIRIDGNPIPPAGAVQPGAAAPPFLPRAVAPPVGDISVSNINASAGSIDLGSTTRIPRLVLKNAPSREVLEVLARAAGLNVVFFSGSGTGDQGAPVDPNAPGGQTTQGGPLISLNVEDESVQDVFNNVIQLSGLQANRIGRTIFVGSQLPESARNIISRSFRLNQVPAGQAVGFLVSQGAERQQVTTQTTLTVVGEGPAAQRITNTTTAVSRIAAADITPPVQAPGLPPGQPRIAPLLLRGLLVSPDERLNAVTLVGEPRQVEVASALLTQLDLRRRQVAINVKILDVNLSNTDQFNSSLSFGIGNSFFNFTPATPGGISGINLGGGIPAGSSSAFQLQLQAAITNGNAKILTDPTLVVQESQTATVNLTQDVFGGFTTRTVTDPTTNLTSQVVEPIINEAGLTLNVQVNQIDDNGFVTLAVNPTISSPSGSVSTAQGAIGLIQRRELASGQIRLRDGQTLIISGIIQESDQSTVTKVPILGDIPLLGALFRRTNRSNQRNEVVVLLTPQIIDDSAPSSFGYTYTPGSDARQLLQRQGFPTQGGNR
jgi:type IV pilus assembly protein PilQ